MEIPRRGRLHEQEIFQCGWGCRGGGFFVMPRSFFSNCNNPTPITLQHCKMNSSPASRSSRTTSPSLRVETLSMLPYQALQSAVLSSVQPTCLRYERLSLRGKGEELGQPAAHHLQTSRSVSDQQPHAILSYHILRQRSRAA